MKQGEKGFSFIELIIAVTIISLVSGAAAIAIFQVLRGTERNNNYMTVVRQVQNAGFFISRDTQMAQNVITDNLTSPDFLLLSWTQGSTGDEYQVAYTLNDMPGSQLKQLHRNQSINGGGNTTTFIAHYIDPDSQKTKCEFANGTLTLAITAIVGEGAARESETRTYKFVPRPG